MAGGTRLYDRLPLQLAQVIHDVRIWRAHKLKHEDTSADDYLYNLQEAVDALLDWESQQDPQARVVIDLRPVVRMSSDPPPAPLRLVKDDDEE